MAKKRSIIKKNLTEQQKAWYEKRAQKSRAIYEKRVETSSIKKESKSTIIESKERVFIGGLYLRKDDTASSFVRRNIKQIREMPQHKDKSIEEIISLFKEKIDMQKGTEKLERFSGKQLTFEAMKEVLTKQNFLVTDEQRDIISFVEGLKQFPPVDEYKEPIGDYDTAEDYLKDNIKDFSYNEIHYVGDHKYRYAEIYYLETVHDASNMSTAIMITRISANEKDIED